MKKVFLLFFVFFTSMIVVFVLVRQVAAQADSCKDILSGMYNIKKDASETTQIESLYTYVCHTERATNFSIDIPQQLQADLNDLRQKCNPQSMTNEFRQKAESVLQTLNPIVVSTWYQCMDRPGLKVFVIMGEDPANFSLNFRYEPVSENAWPVYLASKGSGSGDAGLFFQSNATVSCSPDWINVSDDDTQKRKIAPRITLACSRSDPLQPVNITINTQGGVPVYPNTLKVPAGIQ